MQLSKTKYCRGIQCKKILWLDTYKPEEATQVSDDAVLENGTEVGELAKGLFGKYSDVAFSKELSQMIEKTKEFLLNENIVITEASFQFENLFCSVDILKKTKNQIELYEVKSSTEIKDIYIHDISYQYYLLKKLGYSITKASIVSINPFYERKGELDLKKLFVIHDVTNIVEENREQVEDNIRQMERYMKTEEIEDNIDMHCFKPYPCPYFSYCTKHLEKENIFSLRRMPKKKLIKFYKEGITSFEQLKKININDPYKRQVLYELEEREPHIDVEKMNMFLSTLQEPLYFLDFETFQEAIPKYDYTRPYMQIPFQYSLHSVENGKLKHKEFLSKPNVDPRRELALRLVKDIPMNACVVAYNMMFEKMIVKHLSELYPDLRQHLLCIYENMHDLMIPFKEGYYYTKEMKGSYSIKYVLPALFPDERDLDYHHLDMVHNGKEAMHLFKDMINKEEREVEQIRKALLAYCKLDTYAMVKIWYKLKDLVDTKQKETMEVP